MGREGGPKPPTLEDMVEKKLRSGARISARDTKVSIGEKEFANSAQLEQKIGELLEQEGLTSDTKKLLKDWFERSVEREVRDLGEEDEEKIEKSLIMSRKFGAFEERVHNAIENSNSDVESERLIPVLDTQKKFGKEFEKFKKNLQPGEQVVLVTIDLDDFKRVNDRNTNEAGDELLKSVGTALFKRIRSTDRAAHFSGDEFACMLKMPEEQDPQIILSSIIEYIQNNVRRPVSRPTDSEVQGITSGYSVFGYEEMQKTDFTTAREMADKARKISKLKRVVYGPGESTASKDRVVRFDEIKEITSKMDTEDVVIGQFVLGVKREVDELIENTQDVHGGPVEYSLEEVKKIGKLIRSGKMKNFLAED